MNCSIQASPIVLPFADISVHANGQASARGIAVEIGTPGQTISLLPTFNSNNTLIPNSQTCQNNLSNLTCATDIGGLYLSSDSESYSSVAQGAWNGTNTLSYSAGYFNDLLATGSNRSLPGYPMIEAALDARRGYLGTDTNSSFLDSLASLGLIASRACGFWFGSESADSPADGSLIVGGYDANRFGSDNSRFGITAGCHACVRVTSFKYIDSSGATSLLDDDYPFITVLLEPFYSHIEVPPVILDRFHNASKAVWLEDQNWYGWESGSMQGSLNITLSNGYQTSIPASEIGFPAGTATVDSYQTTYNASEIVSNVWNSSDVDHAFNWGGPFLSMNYMLFDPDQRSFSLSPVSKDMRSASASVQPLCSASAAATATATAKPEDHKGLSGGAIGGIVGGVVGGLLILAILLCAWCLVRRKRRRDKHEQTIAFIDEQKTQHSELYADTGYGRASYMTSSSVNSPMGELGGSHPNQFTAGSRYQTWRPPAELPSEVLVPELPAQTSQKDASQTDTRNDH